MLTNHPCLPQSYLLPFFSCLASLHLFLWNLMETTISTGIHNSYMFCEAMILWALLMGLMFSLSSLLMQREMLQLLILRTSYDKKRINSFWHGSMPPLIHLKISSYRLRVISLLFTFLIFDPIIKDNNLINCTHHITLIHMIWHKVFLKNKNQHVFVNL
jgi:hypothetical protein